MAAVTSELGSSRLHRTLLPSRESGESAWTRGKCILIDKKKFKKLECQRPRQKGLPGLVRGISLAYDSDTILF